jgi:hypothetical protein
MEFRKTAIFVTLILLLCAGAGAVTFRLEASPLWFAGMEERILPRNFTIKIYMDNDDGYERVGFSFPLVFYSPNDEMPNVFHRNVGGVLSTHSLIDHWPDAGIIWNIANEYVEFGWNGVLPDTMCHGAAAISGWLPGMGEILTYEFAFRSVKVHDYPRTFCVDSTRINDINDWLWEPPSPSFGGPYCWDIGNPPYMCGDADANGVVNILDVTYLISFVYKGGKEPLPFDAGDANADFVVNILDITYLINYLYKDGPDPQCCGEELPIPKK